MLLQMFHAFLWLSNIPLCVCVREIYDITCVWNQKNNINEFICQTETDSQTENKLTVTKVKKEV